jgi:tetratricopeptide (TPR) repeat protein
MGRMTKSRLTASTLALCTLIAGAHAQQDKVIGKDGKERSVKIESEDYDGLKISVQGGTMTTPWKDVDSIRYGNAGKYQEALDSFNSASPSQTLPLLEALAADDKLRPVLRQGVLYHLGLTYRRVGNSDKAITTLEQVLKDFPKSRYLLQIGANLLSLYATKGDASGAVKALDPTLKGATGAQFDFLRGRLLEEQKKYPDAERTFQSVVTGAGSDTDLQLAAKLAIARCAHRADRVKEAEDKYREIVKLDAPNDVMAGAWNGLGELALARGTKARDADDLRYALFAFLRGKVLYVPDRGGTTDEYERALAGAAMAFKAVGELENDATKKKQFLSRAQECRDQLQRDFPRSRHLENKPAQSGG